MVKHTLTARNWILVVIVTAVLAALVGGAVGYVAASHSQQTIVEKFFPNSASFPKPADVQEVLAKVEPAVVSIETTPL